MVPVTGPDRPDAMVGTPEGPEFRELTGSWQFR